MLTPEQEKERKMYIRTCSSLHVGVEKVFIEASRIIDILGWEVCEQNNLFSYVMEASAEEIHDPRKNSNTILKSTETRIFGLAPVNPKLLVKLMMEAGK